MRLFKELVIETSGTCNRVCKTCLRQTYPGWQNGAGQMPASMVYGILDEAAVLGFRGIVCLQFFNEPLMDSRIGDFGRYARGKGFARVMVNTNGDYILKRAVELDGVLDRLNVALYGGNKERRQATIQIAFCKTELTFTDGTHIVTHYSPYSNLQACIEKNRPLACRRNTQLRLILSHTGEMRLCCEDIAGEWDLGKFGEKSLEELWFGEKHSAIVEQLSSPGGRTHPYCQICPCGDWPI